MENKAYGKSLYYSFLLFAGFTLLRSLLDVPSIAYIFYTYFTDIPIFPMSLSALATNGESTVWGLLGVALYCALLFSFVRLVGDFRTINRTAVAVIAAVLALDGLTMLLAAAFGFGAYTDEQLRLFRLHGFIEVVAAAPGVVLLIRTKASREQAAERKDGENRTPGAAVKALCVAFLVYLFVLPTADHMLCINAIGGTFKYYPIFPAATLNAASVYNLGNEWLRPIQNAVIAVIVISLALILREKNKRAFRASVVLATLFSLDAAALLVLWIVFPALFPTLFYAVTLAVEAALAVFFAAYARYLC